MRGSRGAVLAMALMLAGLVGCESGAGEPQAAVPSVPAVSTLAIPAGTAPIEPGTYRVPSSAWSVADFTVTFPEGWTVQDGHTYLKHPNADDELGFYAVDVDEIFADACEGSEGGTTEVGPTVHDLAAALVRQKGVNAEGPYAWMLGGYPALGIDLFIPKHLDLKACNLGGVGLQIWYSPPVDQHFVLLHDGIGWLYILDVDGQRQVFVAQHRAPASRRDIRELQAVLDSIQIET